MTEEKAVALVDQTPHEMFDLADEDQIVAELQGRVTEKYVYELKIKDESGKPVVGLSYAGTNWACREYAKRNEIIRVEKDSIDYQVDPTNDQYVIITVIAQRFSVNPDSGKEVALDTAPGLKRQWTKMKRNIWRDGQKVGEEVIDDPFFWEKGLSKATRNAKQALIPVDIIKELISKALEQKHNTGTPGGQRGAAPQRGGQAQRPPGKDTAPSQQGNASQASPTAAPPAAAGQPPPGGGQPASPAAGGAASGKPSGQTKDSLVQGFEVVLKSAFKTQDGAVARAALKKLSGSDKITDLAEADLRKYGKLLQAVARGECKIAEDGSHIFEVKSGNVLWGTKGAVQTPEAPADPAPPAAPSGTGDPANPGSKFF